MENDILDSHSLKLKKINGRKKAHVAKGYEGIPFCEFSIASGNSSGSAFSYILEVVNAF